MNSASFMYRRHADYLALGSVLLCQPLLTLPPGSRPAGWLALLAAWTLGWVGGTKPADGRLAWLAQAVAATGLTLLLPEAWRPGLFLLAAAGLAGAVGARGTGLATAGRRAGTLFLLGSLLSGGAVKALAMVESWPPAGWAALGLGRLAGLAVALVDGHLVLGTPLEHMPFSLAPEWTGLLVQALLGALALLWWRGRWRRLPHLLLVLLLTQLWLGGVFLFLCQTGAALDFYELPWQPLLWLGAGLPGLWLALRLLPEVPVAVPPAPVAGRPLDLALMTGGLALLLAGLLGQDGGEAKAGRLLIDDGHSDWEWVETPMSPDVFGSKTTYNYHGLGRLLSQYYDLAVTRDPLTPTALAEVDLLVLKTPTRPYEPGEIAAILAFVRQGGGLYLISDHTNVFGMSTWLNQVAEPLGLGFKSDAVFALRSRADQVWRAEGVLPHPAAAGLKDYRFLTSCSIRPGWRAEVVMAGAEAGATLVCYHESNFFNPHPPRSEYRFGSLVQAAAVKVGRGRVLGFTDSTTYSNFAMFWPGRLEQVLAALAWLNHRNAVLPWTWLALGGGLLLLAGVILRRPPRAGDWVLPALGAGLLVLPLLRLQQAAAHPAPVARRLHPAASVDQGLSQATFPLRAKPDPQDPLNLESFVIWLDRSELLPVLTDRQVPEHSRLHILVNPRSAPDQEYQARLDAFLAGGGRLLVALRPSHYTPGLNAWLARHGMGFGSRLVQNQAVFLAGAPDSVWVDEALSVTGGRPFVQDRLGQALAAEQAVGDGLLVVSGLADCFANRCLGSYDSVPAGPALGWLRLYYRHVGLVLAADTVGVAETGFRDHAQ